MTHNMNDTTLQAVVRRLSGAQAELEVGGQTLRVPTDKLPTKLTEGDNVVISLQSIDQATAERHEFARALLTEILGGNS
jgi:hypothetical protein